MSLVRLGPDAPAADLAASLDEHGYALVEGVLDPADTAGRLAALDGLFAATPTGRNSFEGYHTRGSTRSTPRPGRSTTAVHPVAARRARP